LFIAAFGMKDLDDIATVSREDFEHYNPRAPRALNGR